MDQLVLSNCRTAQGAGQSLRMRAVRRLVSFSKPLLLLLGCWSLGLLSAKAQDQMRYGLLQDTLDPYLLTAVAYPNFSSNNNTISTALFTFYLPAGTTTVPAVPALPAFGNFTNITGNWQVEKITPALYASFGFDPQDLQGNDVYQCILQNSPVPNTTENIPIRLFSLRLPADCIGGTVRVHINDNAIHQALLANFAININNQMSVSVNDGLTTDIYAGNNAANDDHNCPINSFPIANPDTIALNEDTPTNLAVTANDSFGDDGPASAAIVITVAPQHGIATVNTSGTPLNPVDDQIFYTPTANYFGPDTLYYRICDLNNECDTARVLLQVNNVNDGPNAVDDVFNTNEDVVLNGDVSSNDSDIDGPGKSITVVSGPGSGNLVLNPNGTFTYTPAANATGNVSFSYSYCDTGSPNRCDTASVSIQINAVNDAPDAVNDTLVTNEDVALSGDLSLNDSDVDGPGKSITLVSGPGSGNLVLNANGTFTYTPAANVNGLVTFTYSYCDGGSPNRCDTATVRITINPVNDPPVITDDGLPRDTIPASTPEDTQVTICVTIVDVDGDVPTCSLIQPLHGTAVLLNDTCVVYTPAPNYNGPDQLRKIACDPAGACDTVLINITVTPVNDLPIALNDTFNLNEDTPLAGDVSLNDSDIDGPGKNIALITGPGSGNLVLNPNGTFTYTPAANVNGTQTFSYSYCDGGSPNRCDTATVTLQIQPVNDPPVITDDGLPRDTIPATTPEDTQVTICVTIVDVDGDVPATSLIQPQHGTAVLLNDTCVVYTPTPNYNGPDVIRQIACDPSGACDTVLINITVTPVNDLPIALNDTFNLNEDTPVSGDVSLNDSDIDGPGKSIALITGPGSGNLILNANGTFTYTPAANVNGTQSFSYSYCDGGSPNRCDTASVTLLIQAVNDKPIANDDSGVILQDSTLTIVVTANDSDVDLNLNPNSVQIINPGSHGTASAAPAGTAIYVPSAGYAGLDTFSYRVCDFGTPILCDTALVAVNISPTSVRLRAKMLLQGAVYNAPDTLMRDNLRSMGLLPVNEPYAVLPGFVHVNDGGGETVSNPGLVFSNQGANSIVDWVFVELRAASKLDSVIATRSGLLQRDGDVVDTDGTSALLFDNVFPGSYYVSVRHRNHLGTMTAASISMTFSGTVLDLRDLSTPLWDDGTNLNGFEQVTISGRHALWAANASTDKSVVYAGQNNDKDFIFNIIDQAPTNLLRSQTFILTAYSRGDVNLDGKTIFAGQQNDVDFIFNNVDNHPRNVARSQTYIIREQLP